MELTETNVAVNALQNAAVHLWVGQSHGDLNEEHLAIIDALNLIWHRVHQLKGEDCECGK